MVNVTVPTDGQIRASKTSLTFGQDNWNWATPQTVTFVGALTWMTAPSTDLIEVAPVLAVQRQHGVLGDTVLERLRADFISYTVSRGRSQARPPRPLPER